MKKKQEKIDFSETFSSNVYGGHVCGQSFWVCKTPSKLELDRASSVTIDEDYFSNSWVSPSRYVSQETEVMCEKSSCTESNSIWPSSSIAQKLMESSLFSWLLDFLGRKANYLGRTSYRLDGNLMF